MANLGFVGLGVMGSEMVNRLLSKGHSVTGYNRTRSKAEWLIKKGMKWADTPKAVVSAGDVTFSMVTNSAALGAVMNGPDGMLAAAAPGKLFVDMSTVSPAFSREIINNPGTDDYHYISVDADPERDSPTEMAKKVADRYHTVIEQPDFLDTVARNGAAWYDRNVAPGPAMALTTELLRIRAMQRSELATVR